MDHLERMRRDVDFIRLLGMEAYPEDEDAHLYALEYQVRTLICVLPCVVIYQDVK